MTKNNDPHDAKQTIIGLKYTFGQMIKETIL
jgi:hypothetical protein